MFKRSSGVLLHISSLPGNYGIGTLGKEAYRFVDFLHNTGQTLWQVLPLGPADSYNCPYVALSAYAGNHLFIDIDLLVESDLLKPSDIESYSFPENFVFYNMVKTTKYPLLKKAFIRFTQTNLLKPEFDSFCSQNEYWLTDFSLFMALMENQKNKPWHEWEKGLKFRNKKTLSKVAKELENEIEFHKFLQFVFYHQWDALKKYANEKGIKFIGDNPIYVSYESCDVWTHPELFQLNDDLKPTHVSGVPPDYFCPDGQLWRHPLYNWENHIDSGFEWWINNISSSLKNTDILRIDHFIGFVNYWAVPSGQKTAKKGKWRKAPGKELFTTIQNTLGNIPVIAEDLGSNTPEVENLKKEMCFPGMKLLQEGITGGYDHPFAPHNYDSENYVVYTSTHDSNTVKGWYEHLYPHDKNTVLQYLCCSENDVVKEMIKQAWMSKAVFAIAQMQDILELGTESRMNIPGKNPGNWQWRMKNNYHNNLPVDWLYGITKHYNR